MLWLLIGAWSLWLALGRHLPRKLRHRLALSPPLPPHNLCWFGEPAAKNHQHNWFNWFHHLDAALASSSYFCDNHHSRCSDAEEGKRMAKSCGQSFLLSTSEKSCWAEPQIEQPCRKLRIKDPKMASFLIVAVTWTSKIHKWGHFGISPSIAHQSFPQM